MALDKDIIVQYALGELSADEMKRVKSEIESDPAAQEELKTYQLSLGDLDQKFQEARDEPIPSHISQRIDQVSSSLQREPKKKTSFFPYFGTAAGGGLVGAIATAMYMTFAVMTPATVSFKGLSPTDMYTQLEEQSEQIEGLNTELDTLKTEVAKLEQDASKMGSTFLPLVQGLTFEDMMIIQDSLQLVFDESNENLEPKEIQLASLDQVLLTPLPKMKGDFSMSGSRCSAFRERSVTELNFKPQCRIVELSVVDIDVVIEVKACNTPYDTWSICSMN